MIQSQRPPATGIFAPEPAYQGQAWQFSKIGQGPSFMKMEKEHAAQTDTVLFTSTCEGPDCPQTPDDLVVQLSHGHIQETPTVDICIRQEHADTGINLQFAQKQGETFEDQSWGDIQKVVLQRDAQTGRTTLATFSPGSEVPTYFANLQNPRSA